MEWYWKQYLQDPAQGKDPLVSVLHANDLTKLPPALMVTAEFDVLRDQGKAYADKLKAAGVSVQYKCYPGQIHSFMGFAVTQYSTDVGFQALAEVGQQVQEHYSTKQLDWKDKK
jgi:acetyl esterase